MTAARIMEPDHATRHAMCFAMRALVTNGLNRGTAGNISVRTSEGFLVTPSGIKPAELRAEAMVRLSPDGERLDAGYKPSSEWRFHKDIYATRADAGAVVHVHSPYAAALACRRRDIPPFHYMIAKAGGDSIRCATYATFGTQALSDAALAALDGRRACLLANHGLIAIGRDLEAAMDLALEVEELAQQYTLAMQHGDVVLLDAAQMQEVMEQFKDYGNRHDQDRQEA